MGLQGLFVVVVVVLLNVKKCRESKEEEETCGRHLEVLRESRGTKNTKRPCRYDIRL